MLDHVGASNSSSTPSVSLSTCMNRFALPQKQPPQSTPNRYSIPIVPQSLHIEAANLGPGISATQPSSTPATRPIFRLPKPNPSSDSSSTPLLLHQTTPTSRRSNFMIPMGVLSQPTATLIPTPSPARVVSEYVAYVHPSILLLPIIKILKLFPPSSGLAESLVTKLKARTQALKTFHSLTNTILASTPQPACLVYVIHVSEATPSIVILSTKILTTYLLGPSPPWSLPPGGTTLNLAPEPESPFLPDKSQIGKIFKLVLILNPHAPHQTIWKAGTTVKLYSPLTVLHSGHDEATVISTFWSPS